MHTIPCMKHPLLAALTGGGRGEGGRGGWGTHCMRIELMDDRLHSDCMQSAQTDLLVRMASLLHLHPLALREDGKQQITGIYST